MVRNGRQALVRIDLSENRLTNEIPEALQRLRSLKDLRLAGKWLSGRRDPETETHFFQDCKERLVNVRDSLGRVLVGCGSLKNRSITTEAAGAGRAVAVRPGPARELAQRRAAKTAYDAEGGGLGAQLAGAVDERMLEVVGAFQSRSFCVELIRAECNPTFGAAMFLGWCNH